MISSALTAITRKKESVPARHLSQTLDMNGLTTILDWGCGHGADVKFYKGLGDHLMVKGYDPGADLDHSMGFDLLPDELSRWNVITCFYVLNVLPTKKERIACLQKAAPYMSMASKMYIAVRSRQDIEKSKTIHWKKFRDGYLTSRNTFQRGFTQAELTALVKASGLVCARPWSKSGFVGCVALS